MAVLLLVAVAILGGTMATYGFDRESPGYARLATGCVVGMTTLAFSGFILALGLGMGAATLVLSAIVTMLPAVLLRQADVRMAIRQDVAGITGLASSAVRHPTPGTLVTAAYGLLIAIGVWLVADHTFFETPDGLFIGNVNNLGDLPYHVQISASFAYGDNFPPQNPVFSGSGFSYHYIADFLAAIYVAAGASLVQGMLILNVALGASLLVLVHRWTRTLTGSAVAARLAPLLLAFSGGLGWVLLLDQARTGGHGLVGAFNSGDRYTIQPDGLLRFGNAVTTLLIPQRGLLLGMGLAVIVFTLLWRQLGDAAPGKDRPARATGLVQWPPGGSRMLVAGVLTGILPIVHAHTFAVVFGTAFLLGVCFAQWREGRWRAWVVYVASTIALALPILAWTARGSQASLSSFFGVELWWDHGTADPIWFWFTNTGAFIPILVAAFAWRGEGRLPRRLLLYTLPFLAWFVVPNVLRLAPWLWDNIKVLSYWWLGCVPVVALVLARLWERQGAAKVAAVALAFVLMAAGALDIVRAAVGPSFQEFDRDGITFAEMIREKTPPTAVILTEPTYNTAVFLTGRRVFMGYAGFLWANGLPYVEREQEVHAIYMGEPGADDLLARNDIAYIVDGPQERGDTTYPPNDAYLAKFPVVAVSGEYRLLEVPKP
jgi:hypothetical protein